LALQAAYYHYVAPVAPPVPFGAGVAGVGVDGVVVVPGVVAGAGVLGVPPVWWWCAP
jgi:hypothetical protein